MAHGSNKSILAHTTALIALMRLRELVPFVLVTTLMGAKVGGARFGLRLLVVVLANIMVVTFAFMINDVEDAADDALNPLKVKRNPVSAGRISARTGYWASLLMVICALALYASLGVWPFVFGALCGVLAFFYSWRPVRLKAIPLADLLSHGLMLAALQFICAYTAFRPMGGPWLAPCLFVFTLSLYGQLYNQLRDLDGDRQAGVNHTAARIGSRTTFILMIASVVIAFGLLAISVWQHSIPLWVILASIGLSLLVLFVMMQRARLNKTAVGIPATLNEPIVWIGALVMLVWMIVGA